jgi:hypothetical protein
MVLGWPPFYIVSDSLVLHSKWLLLLKIEISLVINFCLYKCENLRCTTDGRMPSDGKSSHGLWPGELKYYIIVSLEYQGWFWLENKITENQWKIAETIYTPFSNGIFLTCSDLCQTTFCNFFPEEISWNQLNNWTKIIPVSQFIPFRNIMWEKKSHQNLLLRNLSWSDLLVAHFQNYV